MARELPGYQLATLLTHSSDQPFGTRDEHNLIGLQRFDDGDDPLQQASVRRQWAEWQRAGRILRWLREHPPAAVIVSTYNDIGRLRVVAWCNRRGIPVLLMADSNIRGDRASSWRAVVKRLLLHWLIRRCAAILPFGRLGRDYFLKYGADPAQLFLAPCEPDYDLIGNRTRLPIEALAARLALQHGRRRFIYCGRLAPEKRVDLLLDAFAQIAGEIPEWDLLICGDGPLRDALQRQVAHELASRVMWAGHLSDPAEVAAAYHLCDVLVLPSDYEPWALVVNEAAAAGLGLICSEAVGAAADLLEEGVNGYIVPTGDVVALVSAMRAITRESAAAQAASRNILQRWRRQADPIAGIAAALTFAAGSESPCSDRSCGLSDR
jgi:glycosyltransferase involved in cell wall biosynthesis